MVDMFQLCSSCSLVVGTKWLKYFKSGL